MAPSTKRNSARSSDHRTARNTQVYLLSASLLFLSIACSDDPEQHYTTRRDSAGIEIIEIGAGDKLLAWEFEEEFRLGGKDVGPEAFYRVGPSNAKTDSLGNIYILNGARFSTFSPEGRFLWAAGTEGGGPGEIRLPGPIAVTPGGTVGVYDWNGAKLVRFDSEGRALDRLALQFSLNRGKIHVYNNSMVYLTWGGASLEEGADIRLVRIENGSASVLALVNIPNNKIKPPGCPVGLAGRPPVFTPETRWAAARDNIAVTSTADYTVNVFVQGEHTRIVRRAIEPIPATEADGLREMGGGISVGFMRGRSSTGQRPCSGAALLEAQGMAEVMPVIKRMAMAPDGALWVETRKDADDTSIDVFDSSGDYQGTLPQETPFPVIFLPGNKIGAAIRNDDGVDHLVIYRVVIGE
ncbi:MAG: hypothetical protein OEY63_03385 [Gemmatimonadota bacterium]|nr:hypothetical protein [Gemmatimonadota bacterium]MDH5804566.1 hypothetical protein [Gemmatimonadota bacterium]